MLHFYFKRALRQLVRARRESLLQVTSLAAGVVSFLLLSIYVWHETNYDTAYPNAENKYRIVMRIEYEGKRQDFGVTGVGLAPIFSEEISGIKRYTRSSADVDKLLVRQGRNSDVVPDLAFVDANFLDFFGYTLAYGDAQSALAQPDGLVLSYADAERLFGQPATAIGKALTSDYGEHTVTGVLAKEQAPSHLSYRTFMPIDRRAEYFARQAERLGTLIADSYLELEDGRAASDVEAQIERYAEAEEWSMGNTTFGHFLQPVGSIHLGLGLTEDLPTDKSPLYVQILLVVAVILLVAGTANYVLLSVVSLTRHYQRVGIHKVLGARGFDLLLQLMVQTLLHIGLAVVVGGLLLLAVQAQYEAITSIDPWVVLLNAGAYHAVLGGALVLVLLLGSAYPAYALGRMRPVKALRSGGQTSRNWGKRLSGAAVLRSAMVVTQVMISVGLLVSVYVAHRQLSLLMDTQPGFRMEGVYAFSAPTDTSTTKQMSALVNELRGQTGIEDVSIMWNLPGRGAVENQIRYEGGNDNERLGMKVNIVDEHFIDILGLELVAGRNFAPRDSVFPTQGYIVNEAAVKAMGYEQPLGKEISFMGDAPILGVVKDFHFAPLEQEIQPMVLAYGAGKHAAYYVAVAFSEGAEHRAVEMIDQAMLATTGRYPHTAAFLTDWVAREYNDERILRQLLGLFTGVAILLSSMGLVALCGFFIERKRKEVGVRRVLGATPLQVLLVVFRGIGGLVAIACVLGLPAAWWGMSCWLEQFALRIEMGPALVLPAVGVLLLTVLLVLAWQGWRVLREPPTEALRSE